MAAAAVGAFTAVLAPAGVSWADEGPVTVDPSTFGWVTTEVTDVGSSAGFHNAKRVRPRRSCTQHKSDSAGGYATSKEFSGDYPSAGPGGWVIRRCPDGTMDMAWVPAPIGPEPVTPQRLAQRATNRLPLPLPQPRFNPSRPSSAGPSTLVNIPTWFWVEGWKPVSQRTQAGGVWAEVVATPVAASWDPGDGSAVVGCAGPGTAWSPGARDSSCRHVYLRSSAGEPANAYTARVIVSWRVTWRGTGGRSGSLPLMQRQISFPVAVAERQTVVTSGGGE